MIKERRKHPRLRIPIEAEYLVAGRREWREGTIWTLGAGGAALLCEEKLDKGTQLDGLHFVVDREGNLPETRIEVAAEVVSIDRKSDFGRPSNFMLGLRFTDLGEQEFELLRQFVFRRLTGNKNDRGGEDEERLDQGDPTPIEIRFKLFDEFVEEVSENISPSGMFIRAHRPLPPGSRFVFQFQLGDDFSLFQGTAEVVWTRRRSDDPGRPPGMGVRFLKLDLTSQKLVRRLVGQRPDGEVDEPEPEHDAPAAPGAALKLSEEAEPFAIAAEPSPADEPGGGAGERGDTERQAELELRLARLEERLGEMKAARDEAREDVARLEEEAEALREESRKLESARDTAEEARGRAETEAGELLAELETLRPDAGAEERLQEAREELERRREEGKLLEAELRQRLEQAAGTEAELSQRLERAEGTETELRQRLERAEAGSEELERQTERAEAAEGEIERRRQEAAEEKREWEATESALRAQLEQRTVAAMELEESLSEASGVEAELRQRLSEQRAARDELEQRLAQGAEIEAALREQAQELRASRDELTAELGRTRGNLDRMRGAAEEMRSRFNGDLSAARDLESDLAASLAQVAEMGSSLEAKVVGLTSARADLAERLARITGAWSSLERGLADIEAQPKEDDGPPAPEAVVEPARESAPAEESGGEEAQGPEPVIEAVEETAEVLEMAEMEEPPPEVEVAEAAEAPAAVEMAEAAEAPPPVEGPEGPVAPPAEEVVGAAIVEEPPAARPAGGLVGVARRAAARLGFGRKTAAETGDDSDAEAASTLEAKTEPVAPEAEAGPVEIEETVRAWAAAWSEQRVEDYLSFYSSDFEAARADAETDSGDAPHAWLPPLAGMELTLGPISQTELAPGRFAVHFEQSVESDSYTRRTGRTLEMVREADAWKIAAESFQEL